MLIELRRASPLAIPGSRDFTSPAYNAEWTTRFKTPIVIPKGSTIELDGAAVSSSLALLPLKIDKKIVMKCKWAAYYTAYSNDVAQCVYEPGTPQAEFDLSGDINEARFVARDPPADIKDSDGGPIEIREGSFTIPAGFYTTEGLCQTVTEQTRRLMAVDGRKGDAAGPFSFFILDPVDKGKWYLRKDSATGAAAAVLNWGPGVNGRPSQIIGSPFGMVMTFDRDIGRVELTYLHLPIQDPSGNEAAVPLLTWKDPSESGDGSKAGRGVVFDRCGVVLLDVGFGLLGEPAWDSPENIFAILGFAAKDLVPTLGVHELDLPDIQPDDLPSFTRTQRVTNIIPGSGDFRTTNQIYNEARAVSENKPTFIRTTGPSGVSASAPPISPGTQGNSPHYLVALDIIEPNTLCSDGRMRPVIGMVTQELEAGGFLFTSVSDAVAFREDRLVSSVTVRILDPSTDYSPVATLSAASALFLRLVTPDPT